jgi:hypothetical protein
MALSANADQNQTTSRILNKLQYAVTDVAADITTATTSDIVLMFDASDGYEPKYADSANVFQLMGVTATASELNAAADGSGNTVAVAAGGAAVTALTGGGTYLVPAVTANVTLTLPAATLGEKHTFVYVGGVADAEDWVIASPTLFIGGPGFFDVGGTNAAVYANGTTDNRLTVNNPAAGTTITFIGNGTNWAVTGFASSADAPAFTTV